MRRHHKKFTVLSALLALLVSISSAQAPSRKDVGTQWWNHVKVLADDNMEGRDTGSPGFQRAAEYVVSKLTESGLQPAGDNGFYQSVKLVQRSLDESKSSLELIRNGKSEKIQLGEQAYFGTRVDLASSLNAPLAFVGYGIRVPESNYDDFAGQDLKGKIVVYIGGSPSEIPPDLASHYQSTAERWKALKSVGAVGTLVIPNPAAMDIPWDRQKLSRLRPSMRLADESLGDTKGWKMSVTWNPAFADMLLAGTGHTAAELFALVKERKRLPKITLGNVRLKAKTKMDYTKVDSFNVVAKLPGTDARLKEEHVVLSAHLDHLGVGEPINGDRINNGAMDNASGSAMLLTIADQLKQKNIKPKRSLIFLFVTAEEKGLLGSLFFVNRPTVAREKITANINIDNLQPIFPSNWFMVRGMNDSDLGAWAKQAVENAGCRAQLDPKPQRNAFIRSDQYNFIKQGIPAVVLVTGYEPGSPQDKLADAWLKERYHAPSDDLNQPVNLETAGKYEEIVENLVVRAANEEKRAQWKPDSFFRRFAVKK